MVRAYDYATLAGMANTIADEPRPQPQPRPQRPTGRLAGLALVLASAACFASGSTATKAVLAAGLTPLEATQGRVVVSAAVLVVALALVRPAALRVRRDEWPLLLGYGVLAFFAVQALYALALSRLPVGVALLLEYLAPVLVALWVRVVRRTVLPRSTWAGGVLAIGGLAVVARVWQGFRLDALGAAFAIAAAAALAAYFLLSERGIATDHDPIGLVAWGAVIGSVPITLADPPSDYPFAALATQVQLGPWPVPPCCRCSG